MRNNLRILAFILLSSAVLILAGCGQTEQGVKNNVSNTPEPSAASASPSESQAATTEQPSAEPVEGDQPVKLAYLGRATVKIETSAGKVIYIDPYGNGDYSKKADIVLITHMHSDHNLIRLVKQNEGCQVITSSNALTKEGYQSFDVDGIKIKAVPAYNQNHRKEDCVGYVLEFDGIKVYHAGDTSKIPEMEQLAEEKLQYALLPCDGVYNMGPDEASECAELIKAENYIPIHSAGSGDYDEKNVNKFSAEKKISMKPGDEIELK